MGVTTKTRSAGINGRPLITAIASAADCMARSFGTKDTDSSSWIRTRIGGVGTRNVWKGVGSIAMRIHERMGDEECRVNWIGK